MGKHYWASQETVAKYNRNIRKHKAEAVAARNKRQAPSPPVSVYHDDTQMDWERYDLYLRSTDWGKLKKRAKERASHRCALCYSKNKLHVHHRTYARIFNERIDDLTVLCETCHALFHNHRVLSK